MCGENLQGVDRIRCTNPDLGHCRNGKRFLPAERPRAGFELGTLTVHDRIDSGEAQIIAAAADARIVRHSNHVTQGAWAGWASDAYRASAVGYG